MTETTNKLEQLLRKGSEYILQSSELELSQKESTEKWSKKEILGHLIDSAINNLQRFTEIQFENKPYPIRKYNQDELVKANDYQNSDTEEIVKLWNSINIRILNIIKVQTEQTLNFKIELDKNSFADLRFLMIDYVDHLEHHLKQIMK
ncbi:DinB family protein [Aquimarina litoralis]|uniref:DinB family protein n=1 Tax=Aquimarina litoralis TaxID=584605 RepID=UPI001C58EC35|nr:DinB family protein [Aquimarina litoralis]MBW1294806.1 DinB family protein [Aquimarina litoralis]